MITLLAKLSADSADLLRARPASARERQHLLFFLGQCRAPKGRGLFLTPQLPKTFKLRLQGCDAMGANCWEIVPRVGQSAAQKLQFVSHLRNFLQQCGFLYGTHHPCHPA